jgi:hypothetical protein
LTPTGQAATSSRAAGHSGSGLCPLRYLPVFAVAAHLEASDHITNTAHRPVLADKAVSDHHEEMQVVRHDDVVLYEYHWIMLMDGGEQLVLHHLPYPRQRRMRSIGTAIGGLQRPHHGTERLPKVLCHMHGDVVEPGPRVVMGHCAAGHLVLYGVPFFHLFIPSDRAAGHCFLFD